MLRAYQVVVGTSDALPPRITISITRPHKVLKDHEANSLDEAISVIGSVIREDIEEE